MKLIFLTLIFALFLLPCLAQERDILDYSAKKLRDSQVHNPDGTYRIPKYEDYRLEQAVAQLKNYPQPFTIRKVISWYRKAKDEKIRASLLRVLAASRDPRAAAILGNSLESESFDVRIASTYGLQDYFINFIIDGGTEQQMIQAQEWWDKNKESLEKEATCISLNATPNLSLENIQKKCLINDPF